MQVDYISRDEAFTVFQSRDPDLANLIEGVDENPLPNIIRLSNIPLDSYEGIQSTIENYKDILKYDKPMLDKKFIDFRSQYLRTSKLVQNLILLKQGVYTILVLFVFTVFIVVFMVISNTIFFLRDEISIIELVGGKSYFIYGPLMIQ
jgi:cell division protein FtsX